MIKDDHAPGAPAAYYIPDQTMIAALRRRGRFSVRKADNRVLPGIRLVSSLLQKGRLRICTDCENAAVHCRGYG